MFSKEKVNYYHRRLADAGRDLAETFTPDDQMKNFLQGNIQTLARADAVPPYKLLRVNELSYVFF